MLHNDKRTGEVYVQLKLKFSQMTERKTIGMDRTLAELNNKVT